jgi:hypothetical protein
MNSRSASSESVEGATTSPRGCLFGLPQLWLIMPLPIPRPLSGLPEMIGDQAFGDLHGVECGAFAKIVGDYP